MQNRLQNLAIPAGLLFTIALWGGNNTGVKVLVGVWPPLWTGATRFLCAGGLMLALLRWTNWLGVASSSHLEPELRRSLWLRGGLSLAVYITVFNIALQFTTASHVALYLGASPVWALVWETWDNRRQWMKSRRNPALGSNRDTARKARLDLLRRFGSALLALTGVIVLFWPTLCEVRENLAAAHGASLPAGHSPLRLQGECLGLACSLLWVVYSRECRRLGTWLSGAEVSAHTMAWGGAWLLPLGLWEVTHATAPLPLWEPHLLGVQLYCILGGGVIAFALWNHALRHWPTSEVFLFNNLIPLSTFTWAHFFLNEQITPTFWIALGLIAAGAICATSRQNNQNNKNHPIEPVNTGFVDKN